MGLARTRKARTGSPGALVRVATAEAAREAERRRLARELHDEMGQTLTAIRLEAAALARNPRDGPATARTARTIERAAGRLLRQLRARLSDLAPPELERHGLVPALRRRVVAWQRETGVACALAVRGSINDLDGPVCLAAYRVVQEALTNAARHARCTRVQVRVGRLPETLGRGALLEVSVVDDGIGFAGIGFAGIGVSGIGFAGGEAGHGLTGLRERVAALAGELAITGGPGRGTRVTARLPLAPVP